ncbi:hypothetical protein [Paenibacillus hexagrammi]|uniref:Uncharacterized protein n=1 Tax=Paenibacillus hexagrammi TaxID=2908839 RepID=A0ABY3SP33_9BACL|nr:hypothetical protein [Paenibacillus sp. YPD9-1]UJF35464.1 hypothetical protein L0M14_10385 [Paenibacillus sp. YPD9-1]
MEFSNPDYSIYEVTVGTQWDEANEMLLAHDFKTVDQSDHVYQNGEYFISLQGTNRVERIQVSFIDKDLRDRNY